MAKVTIIIPNYNHESYIKQRLDSIKKQTFTDWEAIIIDDASSDQSIHLIEDYLENNPNFKIKTFIKNQSNSGSGYKSWEKGIAFAETEYIWIAETDDYCAPTFLEETIGVLELNSEVALAFTASNYVDDKGEFLYNSARRLARLNLSENESKIFNGSTMTKYLPLDPLITNGSSTVFRKPKTSIPEAIFKNKQLSDLFLWTHLLKYSTFACVNSRLNSFRQHNTSTTAINFVDNSELIYKEYCAYLNYFKLDNSRALKIIDHYIKHFLIPKRKTVGLFNITPIEGITSISRFSKIYLIIKVYIKYLFKIG